MTSKMRVLFSGTLSNCEHTKFSHSTVAECATVNILLLTVLSSGARGQVLSTLTKDHHLLITLSVQLCVQHIGNWACVSWIL